MNLDKPYKREDLLLYISEFIPGFETDERKVKLLNTENISEAFSLGEAKDLNLHVFEFKHSGSLEKRVALTNAAFKVMKDSAIYRAIGVFTSEDSDQWRLSLMTATPAITEKGKVKTKWSNPRRFSFLLGPGAKTNTPHNFLVKKGPVKDFEDLKGRFAIEVVNEEFYKQIADLYLKLVGGERAGTGKKKIKHPGVLSLPSVAKDSGELQEFAVRLIGRLVFCWFLKEKKSEAGNPLIPESLLSLKSATNNKEYYHQTLEPLFFQILNTPFHSREKYRGQPYDQIPYLNGGLFAPHDGDHFTKDEGRQAVNNNTVKVPDEWLKDFIEVLNRYNFTIDENTSVDVELSVDPEMLGRIFENLLAEINPETGESARKSTGSFYTPREIVEYMVDQSLIEYLLTQTNIKRPKLKALASYDELDDMDHPLTQPEKRKIIDALGDLKILDPACGSGAFPIGMLQKVVLMLQRTDPEAKLWFEKKIENVSDVMVKNDIKEKFASENWDYIRKLGVIRDSIFGVDIQPIATEIARLRCFLTLIVEEEVEDDKPNRGVQPLPNLDFKFVTANSLISLPEEEEKQDTMFDDKEGIDKLKELRERYFRANNSERESIKHQFSAVQKEMLLKMVEVKTSAELTKALSAWEPFSEKATPWFDPDWMFGVKKFSIVVGNPPYGGTKISDELKRHLGLGSKDIYGAFISRSMNGENAFLGDGGMLSFIVSDTFMTIKSHFQLRQQILENRIHRMIRVHPDTFKATVNTAIILLQKTNESSDFTCEMADLTNINIHEEHDYFLRVLGETRVEGEDVSTDRYAIFHYPQELISTNSNFPFFVGSPKLFVLMNDMTCKRVDKEVAGKKVKVKQIEFNGKIVELVRFGDTAEVKVGLQTGDNKSYLFQNPSARGSYRSIEPYSKFVLTEKELQKISQNEELRKKVVERGFHKSKNEENFDEDLWFGGKHIVPYDKGGASDTESGWLPNYYVPTDYYIDWSQKAVTKLSTIKTARFQNQDYYFKKGLTLSYTGYYAPNLRLNSTAVFDVGGSSIFPIVSEFQILGNFACKITKYVGKNWIDHTVNFQVDEVKEIPFFVSENQKIIQLVAQIIEKQKQNPRYDYMSNEQKEVDTLVYEMYRLNDDDIQEVEKWYARRYPKLRKWCYIQDK